MIAKTWQALAFLVVFGPGLLSAQATDQRAADKPAPLPYKIQQNLELLQRAAADSSDASSENRQRQDLKGFSRGANEEFYTITPPGNIPGLEELGIVYRQPYCFAGFGLKYLQTEFYGKKVKWQPSFAEQNSTTFGCRYDFYGLKINYTQGWDEMKREKATDPNLLYNSSAELVFDYNVWFYKNRLAAFLNAGYSSTTMQAWSVEGKTALQKESKTTNFLLVGAELGYFFSSGVFISAVYERSLAKFAYQSYALNLGFYVRIPERFLYKKAPSL